MLKRRSRWLGGSGALLLALSLSGVVAGATPPDAVPDAVVDTTATFEDIDGNGIDDDCQDGVVVADPAAAAAELLTVDTDANGVISKREAAHSARIGGKNCNHGGYVSGVAHDDADDDADADSAKKDHAAASAARLAAKAERKLAHEVKKAERTLAHEAKKAERQAAKTAKQAERHAAKTAKAKHKSH